MDIGHHDLLRTITVMIYHIPQSSDSHPAMRYSHKWRHSHTRRHVQINLLQHLFVQVKYWILFKSSAEGEWMYKLSSIQGHLVGLLG